MERERASEAAPATRSNTTNRINTATTRSASAQKRHSVHGGPILAPTSAAMQGGLTPRALGETLAFANTYPYSRGYTLSPDSHRLGASGLPPGSFSSALKQHPFAASMTQCNTRAARWETDSADARSDTGTFGIKSPGEWQDAHSYWSSDDDDGEDEHDNSDNGVDVQAWRDNMIKSSGSVWQTRV
jgi:hypothetical protein